MANIRTSNEHHLRAIAVRLARAKSATVTAVVASATPAKVVR